MPGGNYEFEPTLSGSPESGEIVSLWLAPSHAYQLTVSDELSGTTMHHGTFELLDKWDDTAHYIDFTEGTQRQRFDYQIDVVDGATLWLHGSAGRWYALTSLGEL